MPFARKKVKKDELQPIYNWKILVATQVQLEKFRLQPTWNWKILSYNPHVTKKISITIHMQQEKSQVRPTNMQLKKYQLRHACNWKKSELRPTCNHMQLRKISVVTYDPHAIGKVSATHMQVSVVTHMQLGNSQLRPTCNWGISRSWLATHMKLEKSRLRPTCNREILSCDPHATGENFGRDLQPTCN